MTLHAEGGRPGRSPETASTNNDLTSPQATEAPRTPHLSAHDDPARACVADCCAYPDGAPRWLDRDGTRMGPMPPSDHAYWHWLEYHRPPAPPWGSYMDTTPLPLPPGGGGPIAYAMDLVARGVAR